MMVMLMTLKLNHIELQYTQQELVQLSISVADGSKGYHDILDWIYSHKRDIYEAKAVIDSMEDVKAGRIVDGETAIGNIKNK